MNTQELKFRIAYHLVFESSLKITLTGSQLCERQAVETASFDHPEPRINLSAPYANESELLKHLF